MLAVEFTFPGGRYHATPWDRHVNEGAVAWPPEPWRILRALVATWHYKVKRSGKHSEETFRGLIEVLAADLPEYRLPTASHSHTRHYMPLAAPGKTALVLDAFVAVARDEPLAVVWPHVELTPEQCRLLDDLLDVIGYLGRAESWIEARRVERTYETNCAPGNNEIDMDTGEQYGEAVTVLAALSAQQYAALRDRFMTDQKTKKKLAITLPDNLVDALSVETADLRKLGWSQPPAARKVRYLRPLDALKPKRSAMVYRRPWATTVRYVISGKPLPRVEESLRIGELLRAAVMSAAKHHYGENDVPAIFSGHGMPKDNRHSHAFYIPWDSDEDGCIDRLLIYVSCGMDAEQQEVLQRIRRIWSRDGGEWSVSFEGIGDVGIAAELTGPAKVWKSRTPYLHPWHVKKRFTVEDQILRECRERGLPEPEALEPLDSINVGRGRVRRPIHFRRFRSRRGLIQPDRHGSFWRLTFPEAVTGPLTLGFGCHFGLGLFRPEPEV